MCCLDYNLPFNLHFTFYKQFNTEIKVRNLRNCGITFVFCFISVNDISLHTLSTLISLKS